MKQKKLSKRLVLSKETVANLDRPAMNGLLGGATLATQCLCTWAYSNCDSCPTTVVSVRIRGCTEIDCGV